MSLKLEIIECTGAYFGVGTCVVFNKEGGKIGRLNDCVLQLPCTGESGVSSYHATVGHEYNEFFIMDGLHVLEFGGYRLVKPSTNGSQLVHRDGMVYMLNAGNRYALTDIDRLIIGPFVLSVVIFEEPITPAFPAGNAEVNNDAWPPKWPPSWPS